MKSKIHQLTALTTSAFLSLPLIAADKPNVLLVIADDMGVDASACYSVGNTQAKMPNLEKLCKTGLVFDNAYSAPVCSPTRAAIMTGEYGFRTGVGSAIPKDGGVGLSNDVDSLFDQLDDTEYSSNLIGKWHLAGSDDTFRQPSELGIEDYYGLFTGGTRSYFKWTAVTKGEQITVDKYTTTDFTDRALDWIGKQSSPWFLWLAYNAPHTPFHVPPADLYSGDELVDSEEAIKADPLLYYNAALEALDTEIGRLLASIPEPDNTIFMFIGDNGTPGGTKKQVYGDHGMKGTLWEGGVHVPMIVNGPGVTAGRTSALMNSTDLYATVLDIAKAQSTAPDSISFKSVIAGGEGQRSHVYVEHFAANPSDIRSRNTAGWAIRDDQYKLVAIDGESLMMFDLLNDSFETSDLLAGSPSEEILQRKAALEAAKDNL